MVRKAVRTYSQILTDFARADEEDARIRAFYEPSGARAVVRPSADPDLQKKRPASAARKHRYAHMLDWNDDVSAIINVDKHDGGARVGTLAAAFAADRKGNASRALTAALNCAMETASRLHQLPPAPTTSHTSRLAMRLLRAAQTPLPVPISAPGSTTATPRPDMPAPSTSGADPHHISDPAAASTGFPRPASVNSRPSSPQSAPGRPPASAGDAATASPAKNGSIFIPAGSANLDLEEQQQLTVASGTLLNSSARMLYYGSAKPRVSSARGRASGGCDGSSRPVSAPSQKSTPPLSSSSQNPYAPPMLQLPLGRASLTATWSPSPSSVRSRPNSALPGNARMSASGCAVASTRRQTSPLVSPSSRRRSSTASVVTLSFQATVPAAEAAAPGSPTASARHRTPRSSFSNFGNVGGGGDVTDAAPSVSVETARSLGMNPRQLHQVQPKHGPSNGVVVRDPVGPQLIPNRRMAMTRPFSAPPNGNAAAAYDGEAAAESPPVSMRGNATQQVWPPSPSWQPNTGSSPPRQQQQQVLQRGSVSPQQQSGASSSSPQRRPVRHDESFRSVASEPTVTSAPSCGSVAVAAAAAAANAAVSSGIALARRRNAALAGARKALWSQIADAAGVQPYEAQDPDGGVLDGAPTAGSRSGGGGAAAAADSSPYLEAYLAQQAVVGPSSGTSSRVQPRMESPEHQRSTQQNYHSHHSHHHRSNAASESGGSFGMEPSAAYLLVSASIASASLYASSAVLDDPDTTPTMGDTSEPSATAATASSGSRRGSEQERGSISGGDGAQASYRAGGAGSHGSVLRVPSVVKRQHGGAGGGGGGPGNEDTGDAATTPSGSKRVQWGANVWSPRHRQQHNAAGGSTDAVSELDRVSSGIQLSPGVSAGGALLPPPDLGRPPRYPVLAPLGVGDGSDGSGGELVFPTGPASPMSSISPGFHGSGGHHQARKRPQSRLQTERGPDDDDGDSDLPSLEVSIAAGVLDRAAQSPRAVDARSGSAGGAEAPLPSFTDPEFYQLTALVDRTEDVQGWLFNVYLTDITPGNPLARRVCIATCTTADEQKQLLVPPPPTARLRPAAATSQDHSTPSARPLRPLPPSPLISPPELLPWVTRPEQLFGHWLRLEAFAIAPVADKVVDAMTYMGRLDTDLPPPPQPKISKLHVVDIRPAAAAAAHAAAAAAAAAATAGATVFSDAGGSSSNSRSRPSSASSVSTLAAALGLQQLSSAGNAAQVQARLAAEVTLAGRQRPASALVRGTPTWT